MAYPLTSVFYRANVSLMKHGSAFYSLLAIIAVLILGGCAHFPLTQTQRATQSSILSDLETNAQIKLRESKLQEWDAYFEKLTLSGREIKSGISSACVLANNFENYELDNMDIGTSSDTIAALYCAEEKRYWVEKSWWGCFGGGKKTYGPFKLKDNKVISKQSVLSS